MAPRRVPPRPLRRLSPKASGRALGARAAVAALARQPRPAPWLRHDLPPRGRAAQRSLLRAPVLLSGWESLHSNFVVGFPASWHAAAIRARTQTVPPARCLASALPRGAAGGWAATTPPSRESHRRASAEQPQACSSRWQPDAVEPHTDHRSTTHSSALAWTMLARAHGPARLAASAAAAAFATARRALSSAAPDLVVSRSWPCSAEAAAELLSATNATSRFALD